MKRLKRTNINTPEYWDDIYQKAGPERLDSNIDRYLFLANYAQFEDKVLDVGCGDGDQCNIIKGARSDAQVYGVDISPLGIIKAKSRYPSAADFRLGSAYNLEFPDSFFNLVICGETLEHLDHPDMAIREAYRVLRKGGRYLVTCPYDEKETVIEDEHIWSFNGDDLAKMCKGYFRKVWFMPWASGTRVLYDEERRILKDVGYLDFLILLAIK